MEEIMNNYVNNFRCAKSEKTNEFIINFIQDFPIIDAAGQITGTNQVEVASLVMLSDSASNLVKAITGLLTANHGDETAIE